TSRAVQLGGTVLMPPIQVSDAGRMAMIQDPTGAAVLFWQKQNHGGAQLAGVPNTWNWNELYAGDPETAMRFFAGLFGWTYVKEPSARHDYWIHHVGDRMNGGIMRKPPEMQQAPSHWTVYFDVADLSAALDALSSLGGAVCVPPFAVSVGTIAVVSDPQGAMFCLIQMRTPAD
ncbi:MAG: VOC family protein, partial [Planctomycetaceae bacterium]